MDVFNIIVASLSLIAAMVALWVAWDCRRKTTQHLVVVIGSTGGFQKNIENPQGFFNLYVHLKNLGLPIPRMHVSLAFTQTNGLAQFQAPLRCFNFIDGTASTESSDVLCGLVVRFGLRSDQMSEQDKQFLSHLEDIRKQRAVFPVFCDGYQVCVINPYSLSARIKDGWDTFLDKLSQILKFGPYAKDQKWRRARWLRRNGQSLAFSLEEFLKFLKHGLR